MARKRLFIHAELAFSQSVYARRTPVEPDTNETFVPGQAFHVSLRRTTTPPRFQRRVTSRFQAPRYPTRMFSLQNPWYDASAAAAAAAAAPLLVSKRQALCVGLGTSSALLLYVTYWIALGRLQRRGNVPDMLSEPKVRQIFRILAFMELFVVYLAPLLATAFAQLSGGASVPPLGSTLSLAALYFLPNMVMTAVNIRLEGLFRKRKQLLVNYSSTAVNNLWRLIAYVLILLDTQRRRLQAPASASASDIRALAGFRLVAYAGILISVLIMIVFEPVAVWVLAPASLQRVTAKKDHPGS